MGPLIDEIQYNNVKGFVERARAAGQVGSIKFTCPVNQSLLVFATQTLTLYSFVCSLPLTGRVSAGHAAADGRLFLPAHHHRQRHVHVGVRHVG
jgi:hypothetical protein